jgi:tetratricopeptide (TPR) repeat protein
MIDLDVIRKHNRIIKIIFIAIALLVVIGGYVFFKSTVGIKGTDYVIPNVPYVGIYNHLEKYKFIQSDLDAAAVSVIEYWKPSEDDSAAVKSILSRVEDKPLLQEKDQSQERFDNKKQESNLQNFFLGLKGNYEAKIESMQLTDLKKYLNSNTRTPLVIYFPIDETQPQGTTYYPFRVLIGIKESERKLVFHDYWLGNNYEMDFDKFNKMQEKMRPDERNNYLVIQPVNLSEALKVVSSKNQEKYSARTVVMSKSEKMFKDYSIGLGASLDNQNDLSESFFLKVSNNSDFEEYFPPVYKMRTYMHLADLYLAKGEIDTALDLANRSLAMNHDLNKPDKDWPGFDFGYRKSGNYNNQGTGPYHVLGEIYKEKGDCQKARDNFNKILELTPRNIDANIGLANLTCK